MKVLHAILCDEVRKEDNGKLLIIGAYTNDIIISKFPTTMSFALWTRFAPPQKKSIDIDIRVRDGRNQKYPLLRGKGSIDVDEPSKSIFVTFPIVVLIEQPMNLIVEIKEIGGRWKKIFEVPVIKSNV